MDVVALLEKTLREEWSAPGLKRLLSVERLSSICKEFPTLELAIKLRVLMSLLSLSHPELRKLWSGIQQLLDVGDAEADEWVRVIAAIVRKSLPPEPDLYRDANGGEVAPASVASSSSSSSSSSASATAAAAAASSNGALQGAGAAAAAPAKKRQRDALADAVHDMAARISKKRVKWPPVGDVDTKPVMSPNFAPMEWPFLCKHLLPQSIIIDDANRHFTPLSVDHDHGASSPALHTPAAAALALASTSASAAAAATATATATATASSNSSSSSSSSSTAHRPLERKGSMRLVNVSNAVAPAPVPAPAPEKWARVPENVRGIMEDPAQNKVDAAAKLSVADFYDLGKPGRPTSGFLEVHLSQSTQDLDDDVGPGKKAERETNLVLKLNYAGGAPKKIKRNKRRVLATARKAQMGTPNL